MAHPDDICGVCNETREHHGDKNHEFNEEGVLIPLKKPEPPRQEPPQARGELVSGDLTTKQVGDSFLALLEVLIDKNIIEARDVLRILGARR